MFTEALVSTGSPSLQSVVTVAAPRGAADATRRRIDVGGILLDQINLVGAAERIEAFVRSGLPHQVVTVNLDFISIASRDPAFRTLLNRADLAVADGMPLVWLSRIKGEPLAERVAGVELFAASCAIAAKLESRVFLLGAAPGIADTAGRRLEAMHPGLRIAGTFSPPLGPLSQAQDEHIVETIAEAAPEFLFVALGAPRQDVWIREHQARLQAPVAMGVGCSLDLLAGNVRRAPVWMQRNGLEWAFRLGQEPRRLWRRYLLNDLPTLVRLAIAPPSSESSEVALA